MTDSVNRQNESRPVSEQSSTSSGLLAGLRAQDPAAWQRLVTIYAPGVYRQARRAGLRREDSEDVVQEVFRTVASRMGEYRHGDPSDTFHGWLYTIARHKIGDVYGNRKRHPLPRGGSSAQHDMQELAVEGAQRGEEVSYDLAVEQALELVRAEFSQRDWLSFVQMVQYGKRAADVAAELNMTLNQTYLAKSRILWRLREVLGEVE